MSRAKPLIGIPADRRILGPHPFHCVGEKYIAAVARAAEAIPVLIPSLGEDADLDAILASVDGILLTGSPSNVEPQRYAGPPADPDTLHDPHRDATTLPLIPRVIAAGMPLFAVCRGFQEMNVAFGGTLWQKVQEVPGRRPPRGQGSATRSAVRARARDRTRARRAVAAHRRERPGHGEFAALAGRAATSGTASRSRRVRPTG